MRRWLTAFCCLTSVAGSLIHGVPAESLCWGSLYVAYRSTRLLDRCPTPTLIRTWRIRCADGCGYNDGNYTARLSGFGECFKVQRCTAKQIKCLPLAGTEIRRWDPPSLTATIVNREGFYVLEPCGLPECRNAGISNITVECNCDSRSNPSFCGQNDPLIVSLTDRTYRLTDRAGGVEFDLGDNGTPSQVPWTDPRSDEAFLALDRNDNGTIDNGSELFGDVTPQHATDDPNGFLALRLFDDVLSGGDEDGRISAADEIFPQLELWRDANHNGVSESGELMTLDQVGLEWIDLDFRASGRVDRYGNRFRFRALSGWREGKVRAVWNVYLVAQ